MKTRSKTQWPNQQRTCPECGQEFANGFAMYNHKKRCDGTMPEDVHRESIGDAYVEQNDDEEDPHLSNSDDDALDADINLHLGHFGHLRERGTLRDDSVTEYLHWPKRSLTHVEREVIIFLRSLECCQGASMRQTQGSLDYAHRCGGRAALLPRNSKTCWKIVMKVLPPPMPIGGHLFNAL